MSRMRQVGVVAATACLLVVAGCGRSAADEGEAKQRAEQLVAATEAARVAPNLTTEVAASLYGTGAPTVCKVFADGLTTAERNDLWGNPTGRRAKTITTNAVTYGRLVVQTYCPAELSNFDDVVKTLDPVESDAND